MAIFLFFITPRAAGAGNKVQAGFFFMPFL
jgi:hypothetical protein